MKYIAIATIWNQCSGNYDAEKGTIAKSFEPTTPIVDIFDWYEKETQNRLGYGDLIIVRESENNYSRFS